jgi:hypothetical protein
MQGFSAARRAKPKIVRSTYDDDDDDGGVEEVTSTAESVDLEPSIKRLNRATTKRAGSKLKLSFGADEVPTPPILRESHQWPLII